MSIDFDPYLMLGISNDASINDIKAAYRRIAKRLHPDKNQHSPGAVGQFQDISAAYELLVNDDRRKKYAAQQKQRSAEVSKLRFQVIPSKRTISSLSEVQVLYLLADIMPDQPAEAAAEKRDANLNLTLILDQSNSMNGSRLDKVKIAANQIIDQLGPQDIFSVVAFNDFAEIIIPATTVSDRPTLKARVALMQAGGGTEIQKGLAAGIEQNKKYLAPRLVNHIILLTDGNTYGEEPGSLELAKAAAEQGIGISAMGLGDEWNDIFLDQLAGLTGGTAQYIKSSGMVVRFLNDHVHSLANIFAERVQISIAPDPDIKLEYAFRLRPNPQPLPLTDGFMQIGSLQHERVMSVLFQLELPPALSSGFRSLARLAVTGDILGGRLYKHYAVSDLSVDVAAKPQTEEPPSTIIEAISKLTLYRMQERADALLSAGQLDEATNQFNRISTRLLAIGQSDLAQEAQQAAAMISDTRRLSLEAQKSLKFGTRTLIGNSGVKKDSAS